MFKNYFKIAIRNLMRYKAYSFINISGLALGITCCLLILLYVQDELSYDRYHENSDRIYRVISESSHKGRTSRQFATPSIVGPILKREFPEVEQTVRLYPAWRPVIMGHSDRLFQEKRFYYADSTIFDVFSLQFILGEPKTALVRPNTIVLTKSISQKYFGDDNPLGKTLTRDNARNFEVTGIIEDISENSHFHFDFLASYASLEANWAKNEVWDTANFLTYLLLHDGHALSAIQSKIPALVQRELGEQLNVRGETLQIHFEPLTEIHLHSGLSIPGETNGNITTVYAFVAIALLLLLIACINYMNLTTARSARRAREVGVRKVLGAFRGQLSRQFFGESVFTTLFALVLAVFLLEVFLPVFNYLSGKQLVITYFDNPFILIILLGTGVLVSVLAGSYPALFLSAFQPILALKSTPSEKTHKFAFRNKLVVFQFVISIVLIVATLVVKNQLEYVRNKKLGFDKEQIVVLPIRDQALQQSYPILKTELLQNPDILNAAATDGYPSNQQAGYSAAAEGLQENEYPLSAGMIVDPDVIETLGLELIAGKGFPESYIPEHGYFYVINEVLMNRLGWRAEEAVGKWINLESGRKGTVVGVAKDFHFTSLHSQIQPLAMFTSPKSGDYDYLLVKINSRDFRKTLGFIEQKWQAIAPHRPFEFAFLDQEFDALYRSEERVGQLFFVFAGLAIAIACLGLFGLASFTAEQRTKEIGIRKVLGASIPEILLLLSKEFTRLVAIAFVVALPFAYISMNSWLQNFAYRIDIGALTFIFAGVVTIAIALMTVSYQAIKAALANPVEALRYE